MEDASVGGYLKAQSPPSSPLNIYLGLLLFIAILVVGIPAVHWLGGIFDSAIPTPSNALLASTSNTLQNAANNALTTFIGQVIIGMVIVGAVVDIYASIRWPDHIRGIANLFMVFVVVIIWVMFNYFISSSQLLNIFGSGSGTVYQIFSSTWFVTVLSLGLIVSAAINLSGEEKRK